MSRRADYWTSGYVLGRARLHLCLALLQECLQPEMHMCAQTHMCINVCTVHAYTSACMHTVSTCRHMLMCIHTLPPSKDVLLPPSRYQEGRLTSPGLCCNGGERSDTGGVAGVPPRTAEVGRSRPGERKAGRGDTQPGLHRARSRD